MTSRMLDEKHDLSAEQLPNAHCWTDNVDAETNDWRAEHVRTFHSHWETEFHVIGETVLLPRPMTVSVQEVGQPSYRSEGRYRTAESHCYFCYTLSGTGGLTNRHGTHMIGPGEAFLTEIDDPDLIYFYPPSAEEPWVFLAFNFDGRPSRMMVHAALARRSGIYSIPRDALIIQQLLDYRRPAQYAIVDLDASQGAALATSLLTTLLGSDGGGDTGNADDLLVKQAMAVIGENAENGLSVADLAAQVGASREHLSRAFRRCGQQSPSYVIRQRRMHYACRLLADTALTVGQIALRAGYAEEANFCHTFRQFLGTTPSIYRRQRRQADTTSPFAALNRSAERDCC